MEKKRLQQEIAELTREARRINGAKILAQTKLDAAKQTLDAYNANMPQRLAEIALGDDPATALQNLRETIASAEADVRDYALMMEGLANIAGDVGFTLNNTQSSLRHIEKAEQDAAEVEEFNEFRKENWEGDWIKLQRESRWEPEEFDHLRELWSRKHE